MGDETPEPRRRDNKIYGSLWLLSDQGSVPGWMWVAPLIMIADDQVQPPVQVQLVQEFEDPFVGFADLGKRPALP